MEDLKPCPFCGGEARLHVDNGVRVICKEYNCQTITLVDGRWATGVGGTAVSRVIEKWNRRAKYDEYFKPKENTLDFKHFNLYSDSVLKNMNKDELIEYIHMLHHNWDVSDEQLFNVIKINNKLQDELDAIKNQQPYKFEDLKELIGKPIFDYKYKEFYILAEVKEEELYKDEGLEKFMICSDKKGLMRVFFEEGRFYPATKALEYQGKAGDEK